MEAARLREKLKQSEAALMELQSSYAEQRVLQSTVENLKRQMCESNLFVLGVLFVYYYFALDFALICLTSQFYQTNSRLGRVP